MYNNEVTYNDKWDTPENKAAYEKVVDKYYDRSVAYPSCPVSWAPEVLELLETLDKELGIERNTSTIRAYYIQGNPLLWFIVNPLKSIWPAIKSMFKSSHREERNTIGYKVKQMGEILLQPFKYGVKACTVLYLNPIINKVLKPKLRLSQIKEKYGELRIYFDCPPAFDEYVNDMIRKTEIKLAAKGAYYPVESFWFAASITHVETENTPDTISVERGISTYDNKPYVKVEQTHYRKHIKDLGLNLQEVEQLAIKRREEKGNF